MKTVKILLLAVAFTVCLSGFAAGERIAVVNIERVFKEFYKSKIAEDQIKMQAEIYRNYMIKSNEQIKRLNSEVKLAFDNSQNIAVSDEERNKYNQEYQTKSAMVSERKAALELYVKEKGILMQDMEKKKRGEIVGEILDSVKKRSAAEGYDFVFDSSGKTMNEQPSLIIFPPKADLTDAVIEELNRTQTQSSKETNK